MPYPRERRSGSPHSSPSPVRGHRSRSLSRSRRSRSRSHEPVDAFVLDCHLVTGPHTRESRGFGFVAKETVEDAERCIKYLDRSVLHGRLVTVEKAKRKRGRSPTPGRYHGLRDKRGTDMDQYSNFLAIVHRC